MRYVECPREHTVRPGSPPALFLAGGITGCPDWQAQAVAQLAAADVVVCNPRRTNFPIDDPDAGPEQVRWEHRHLQLADLVLFWFPPCDPAVTTQPIAMYELGAAATAARRIVVGADPRYPRRADVVLQLELARPELAVHDTLTATLAAARAELALGGSRETRLHEPLKYP